MSEEEIGAAVREPFFSFFATCAAGTELALKDELRELRMKKVRADRGGVRFEGTMRDAMCACLWSRIANRVLHPISRFAAPDEDALYGGVRDIDWSEWVTPERTLAVRAASKRSRLTHTNFLAQKVKDAIVDQMRDRHGSRPSVDRDDPDLPIFLHLAKDEATLYLDLAGRSLHVRGYRTATGAAPLKETLAAAILRLSGWNRMEPLLDPTCGSGTIAIEADLWARNIAPNLSRSRFAFERWANHDASAAAIISTLRNDARGAERLEGPEVLGSDVDPHAIAAAEDNAQRARSNARFEQRDFRHVETSARIVANLPYGERLDPGELWGAIAHARRRLHGPVSFLLLSPPPRGVLPPPTEVATLWNGALECALVTWDHV